MINNTIHNPANTPENNVTELVFILDKSGSMAGLESDTIGGFNSMLQKQKSNSGTCYVTTVLFDDRISFLHDRLLLADVPQMTQNDYFVGGCTALIDAIGQSIKHIEGIHKYARPQDVPSRTLFVITTDGQENASQNYSSDAVKQMIARHKECGWEFLFIGANIDAVQTAARYGIEEDRAVNYHADGQGTKFLYEAVDQAVSSIRHDGTIQPEWSDSLCDDFISRKKK